MKFSNHNFPMLKLSLSFDLLIILFLGDSCSAAFMRVCADKRTYFGVCRRQLIQRSVKKKKTATSILSLIAYHICPSHHICNADVAKSRDWSINSHFLSILYLYFMMQMHSSYTALHNILVPISYFAANNTLKLHLSAWGHSTRHYCHALLPHAICRSGRANERLQTYTSSQRQISITRSRTLEIWHDSGSTHWAGPGHTFPGPAVQNPTPCGRVQWYYCASVAGH